jgi:hypothetical protein
MEVRIISNRETGEVEVVYPPNANPLVDLFNSTIKFASAGFPLVDEKEKKSRLDICFSCEFHEKDTIFHTEEGRCGICTCYLKIMASMATKSCPLPFPKWVATISPQQDLNTESKSGGCCNG